MHQETAPVKRSQRNNSVAVVSFAVLVGVLFLLPHLVQLAMIGDFASYSPFSGHSTSPMVWDETFLYGAEANYMLTRAGAPAYDDDWEHRLTPYPYSIVPIGLEALIAKITGSLKVAHLLFKFVFPAISAFLLMLIFIRLGSSWPLAALLALAIIVLAFSPRTILNADAAFLHHDQGARAFDTLEASRTPNPNATFPLLLLAAMCLADAEKKRGQRSGYSWAALAGIVGGLLFYSYIYYAIAWSVAVFTLSVVALFKPSLFSRNAWVSLAASCLSAIPFVIWKHVAETSGNYADRTARLGLVRGHMLDAEQFKISLAWVTAAILLALIAWKLYARLDRAPDSSDSVYTSSLLLIVMALMAGGLFGLDMKVVVGFDVESAHHFPHMVLQPLALLLIAILFVLATRRWRTLNGLYLTLLTLLFTAGAVAQVEAARDSVQMFRISADWRELVGWLNNHSATGSVVASNQLDLNVFLPVATHNSVLVSDGSRSSATSRELLERYLLANRLSGASEEQVKEQLLSDTSAEFGGSLSYSYYLFETSPYLTPGTHHIDPAQIGGLLNWFSNMDISKELKGFRVDYVVTDRGVEPPQTPGFSWISVFKSDNLILWQLQATT